MARIRTVKPEFWSSEQVMACSRGSRLLFIGMWNFADDAGRLVDSAKTIKAQIFPGDEDLNSEIVRGMIDELSGNGLLMKYEVDGKAYLQITGWKHQKIDKPQPAKHPEPNSSNDRRTFATDLILSNPNGAYLRGGENQSPRSLATALPTGALASQANGGASGKEAWRGKPPHAVKGPELQAAIAGRGKHQ